MNCNNVVEGARNVFRTQLNVHDGALLQKYLTTKSFRNLLTM